MIALDGSGLSPADVAAVARSGEPVRLSDAARARNLVARDAIAALLERGEPLYGASTGVGALRDRPIAADERERLQWNLLRSHAVGAGPQLSPELVRAAMVVRANQLGAGGAGVAPELLDGLVAALNAGVVPVVRELGSLGTGDLHALSAIALALLGEGSVVLGGAVLGGAVLGGAVPGEAVPGGVAEAVAAPAPPQPITLGLRDALGFMSSNAVSVGRAALLSVDARRLLDTWLTVAALSVEALGADPVVFAEAVQAGRGSPAQAAVAARMRALLSSPDAARAGTAQVVQGPFPFRVLPQVDGLVQAALERLDEVLARELNARTENALIEDGRAWPNGNFHAAELAAALDALRAALAQSATLIAARVSAMLDPQLSGLPAFLAREPGMESGAIMLEYVAAEAAAEARSLTMPTAALSVSASLGVESHASFAPIAARRTADVLSVMRPLIAIELVVAMRALRISGRTPMGEGTQRLFVEATARLPSGLEDRVFGGDVELAVDVLREFSTNPTD